MHNDIFVFADIDDSLIQTINKLPESCSYRPVAYSRDGSALSYISGYQDALLNLLAASGARIIPVTGRSTEALARVGLPFNDYSIASHGALVLDGNGDVLPFWRSFLESTIEEEQWYDRMDHLKLKILERIESSGYSDVINVRIIEDKGFRTYISVKVRSNLDGGLVDFLDEAVAFFSDTGFKSHLNGRNLAFLPSYASKKMAVIFLKDELAIHPENLTIGLGDSISDLGFMSECHYKLTPTSGQISKQLVTKWG